MSVLEIVLVVAVVLLTAALGGCLLALRRSRAQVVRLEATQQRTAPRSPKALRVAGRAARVVAQSAAHVREHGVTSLVTSSIEDLTRWAAESRAAIAEVTAPDGTVTVLFSDIEGSTELNVRLGDRAWVGLLAEHDKLARAVIARRRGRVVKSQGDGFMVVFRHPAGALRAGWEMHRGLASARGRLRSTPISVRIGVHRGVVVARDGDFFGRNVALAARVAAQAGGGETLVSDELREALLDSTEFVFSEPREATLKGFAGPQTLWLVDEVVDDHEEDARSRRPRLSRPRRG